MKPQDLQPGHQIVTDKFGMLTVDREVLVDVGPAAAQRLGIDYRTDDDRVYVDVEVPRRVDISDPAVLAEQAGAVGAQFLSLVPTVRYRLCFRPDAEVRCDDETRSSDAAHAAQLIYGAPNISPGEDWRHRSLRCWTNLAQHEERITAVPTEDGPQGDPRTWCGNVRLVGRTDGVLLAIHRGRPPRATTIRTQWTVRRDQWVSTGRQVQGTFDPSVWAEIVEDRPTDDHRDHGREGKRPAITEPQPLPPMRISKGRVMHRVEEYDNGRSLRSLCRRRVIRGSKSTVPRAQGPRSDWSADRSWYPDCEHCARATASTMPKGQP